MSETSLHFWPLDSETTYNWRKGLRWPLQEVHKILKKKGVNYAFKTNLK